MAQNYTPTSIADALKRFYTPKKKEDLIFGRNGDPFLQKVTKNTNMTGEVTVIPCRVNTAQTRSADVSQAATLSTTSTSVPLVKSFHLTSVENHAWSTITQKVILQTRNDAGAYWDAIKLAAEDAMINLSRDIAHGLYRSGYGSIGVIAANGISSATITLENVDQVAAFHPGMVVVFADSESGDALRNSGASGVVQSVDRDLGKVTFTQAVSAIGNAIANGDYIFVKGDREDSATPGRLKIAGLDAWGPSSAAASNDSFFNVNRSTDSLLQLTRVTGSLSSPEDSLRNGALAVARRGFKLDAFLVSYTTFGNILANASGQILRDQGKGAQLSFPKATLLTPAGEVEILPSYFCQDNVAWGVRWDTWTLYSMGDLIDVFQEDGLQSIRMSASNGLEVRYYSFANLACSLPGANVRVSLS